MEVSKCPHCGKEIIRYPKIISPNQVYGSWKTTEEIKRYGKNPYAILVKCVCTICNKEQWNLPHALLKRRMHKECYIQSIKGKKKERVIEKPVKPMIESKCLRCKMKAMESCAAFAKRTRYDMQAPFICRDCRRVMRAFENEGKVIVKAKKPKPVSVLDTAKKLAKKHGGLSIAFLMRKLQISFNEAKEIIEQLKLTQKR